MSTKLETIGNPESCLNRAGTNEPIFVLRAHDRNAPFIVRQWAELYFFKKGGISKMNERELAKYNDALDTANKMENWRRVQENAARRGQYEP